MYIHCTYIYLRCPDVFLFLLKRNEVITLHFMRYYGTIYNILFSTRITVPRNTIVPKHNDAHIIYAVHNIYNICAVSKQHKYYERERSGGARWARISIIGTVK